MEIRKLLFKQGAGTPQRIGMLDSHRKGDVKEKSIVALMLASYQNCVIHSLSQGQ
jgi:hypothetical protein